MERKRVDVISIPVVLAISDAVRGTGVNREISVKKR
jgi:hypothetical protein